MRTLLPVTLIGLLALSGAAEARPHPHPRGGGVRVVVPAPSVRVVINPWGPAYAPSPRAGWVWVSGYYDARGDWIPGYWRPATERPGWVWVPGYWLGERYVDGYWREVGRPGYTWVDGYYDHGRWVAGYWAPVGPPPPPEPPAPPEPPTHHDYE